jgi:CheY-like chemotaxis protein
MQERKAQLSRELIDEYIRQHGYDPRTVRLRPEAEMMMLLEAASSYAAGRLAEFESTAPVIHIDRNEGATVAPRQSTLRILVVDDEALLRWSLVETLSDSGDEVIAVTDAASAIRAVADAAVPFDVVLLDLRLPDSNDLSLLSRLRWLTPMTRIVLMTAFGTPEISQGALDLGAYRVLNKPFEMCALSPLVTEAHASRF